LASWPSQARFDQEAETETSTARLRVEINCRFWTTLLSSDEIEILTLKLTTLGPKAIIVAYTLTNILQIGLVSRP